MQIDQHHAWLFGWDSTPGIVSVWAERDGTALIWRRDTVSGTLSLHRERYYPWLLTTNAALIDHLPHQLRTDGTPTDRHIALRTLQGDGALRYHLCAANGLWLEQSVLQGARRLLGKPVPTLAAIDDIVFRLPTVEQYLMQTGRTYFKGLAYDHLHRLQFDLETTGLDARTDAIFLIALHSTSGIHMTLDVDQSGLTGEAAEADLIRRFLDVIARVDPDVIENHNIQGFDLPFLAQRAARYQIPLTLGRLGMIAQQRSAGRGYGDWRGEPGEANPRAEEGSRTWRMVIPGREIIDTLDAVRRYDFTVRDLPGHGLKAVARYFNIAPPDRVYLEGSSIFKTFQTDPDRVRKYAMDDVSETASLARLLGGAAFALAQMAPRRYERLADAGPATGILDPLLVRAYLQADMALPAYAPGDGTQHTGAALYLFATGVAYRVVKCDVSSLYPSLMRQFQIGSRADTLGALLALVDQLVELRLAAKQRAKTLTAGSVERFQEEAFVAATKILVNSAYGYLGAHGLTRLADVHGANEVTRRGRETLATICRELAARGVTLLEGDTDGVFFAVPEDWTEEDERRVVSEVGACLPPLIRLEFEGRYQAMFSHEPKNYALLTYTGEILLRGVAFRSSRFEPFGQQFLRDALLCLLAGHCQQIRVLYCDTIAMLRERLLPTRDVTAKVRLKRSPQEYTHIRGQRREAPYEALLGSGVTQWQRGDSIRIYRAHDGYRCHNEGEDPRDYDVLTYIRLLTETYAGRLRSAFAPEHFAALFADPVRPGLFDIPVEQIVPHLTRLSLPEW